MEFNQKELKDKLLSVRKEFSNQLRKILSFKILSGSLLEGVGILIHIMDEKKEVISLISEEDRNWYDTFLEEHSYHFMGLLEEDVFYMDVLEEKVFVDQYSAFEELWFRYYYVLFQFFPRFLVKSDVDRLTIPYEEIFDQNDIEIVRHNLLSRRIKSNLQSENIVNAMAKFQRLFKLDLDISEEEKKYIFKFSQFRNIIIHNSSKVNSIFLREMKNKNIDHEFKEGDLIKDCLGALTDKNVEFLENFSRKIEDKIINDIKRIELYHRSKMV